MSESPLKSDDVAAYLRKNPAFFSEHKDVLSELELGEVQPFHQRQLDVLRQRHSAEKARYEMVVESARSNLELEQDLHNLACRLLSRFASRDQASADHPAAEQSDAEIIASLVAQQFSLDQVRIYRSTETNLLDPDDYQLLCQRVAHGSSICEDRVSSILLATLFGAEHNIASCAFVPLNSSTTESGSHQLAGVMVLGSSDRDRFQPGMGAIFLDRVGQLAGASLVSDG